MFKSGKKLLEYCDENKISIWEAVLNKEIENYSTNRQEIYKKNMEIIKVMEKSASQALHESEKSLSGMIGGEANKLFEYSKSENTLLPENVLITMALGLSTSEVNARMGKIVAAPTAGAAGILPAILSSVKNTHGFKDEQLVEALLTSAGIGAIIMRNASVSGAVGGCQAETGSAAAMGAAALVELMGGSPRQALDAASFALIHVMGLVCDPIAGLVEYPCIFRNSSGAMNSFISAEMALAGIQSLAPFDEVVEAMKEVGDLMNPNFKETALGGMAATPTACRIEKDFFNKK